MIWRWVALSAYIVICIYDFVVVPIWFGLNRPDLASFVTMINSLESETVQMELMRKMVGQHEPFTLMGGGLLHLSFGAILTGTAFGSKS